MVAVLTLLLTPAVWWVAQAVADPTGSLIQYGALGILAALAVIAVRVLFKQQTAAYEREQQRADRFELELQALNKDVREDVMPALTRSTEAISGAMQMMQAMKDRR